MLRHADDFNIAMLHSLRNDVPRNWPTYPMRVHAQLPTTSIQRSSSGLSCEQGILLRIGEHPSRGRVSAKGKRHQSKDPLIIRARDRGDAHRPTSSERLPSSATVRQAAGDAPALLLTFPRQRSCVPWDPVRQRPETPTWPISVPLTGNYGC